MDKKHLGKPNVIAQIGLVVHNIEKTSQSYADFFGVEKPAWFWTGCGIETAPNGI